MSQDNYAQIACHCDQIYDEEDCKERCLQPRVAGDPQEDKFSHFSHCRMILFLHIIHRGNLRKAQNHYVVYLRYYLLKDYA